jgi:hypothetical protein
MSIVLSSKTFVEKNQHYHYMILVGWVQEDQHTSPIAFRSWDDMCKPTTDGGLGIRDPHLINKSLIIYMLPRVLQLTKIPSCRRVYAGTVVSETSEKWCYHLSVIIKKVYTLQLNSQKYNSISSNLHFSGYFWWFSGFIFMQENGHKIKWYSRIYFLKENGRKSWP